jgi:hypothetical protein
MFYWGKDQKVKFSACISLGRFGQNLVRHFWTFLWISINFQSLDSIHIFKRNRIESKLQKLIEIHCTKCRYVLPVWEVSVFHTRDRTLQKNLFFFTKLLLFPFQLLLWPNTAWSDKYICDCLLRLCIYAEIDATH